MNDVCSFCGKTSMTFIKPMLCRPLSTAEFNVMKFNNHVAELKIDGWRAIITVDDGEVHIYSRTGKEYTGHLPHIVKAFQRYAPNHSTFDGELVYHSSGGSVVDSQYIPNMSFNMTARIMGSGESVSLAKQQKCSGLIQFIVFDIIRYGGENTMNWNYITRAVTLDNLLIPNVWRVPSWDLTTENKLRLLPEIYENHLEGLVIKKMDGLYLPGKRSKDQYKIKVDKHYDVVVTGYTMAKEGKFEGLIGALKFGAYDENNVLVDVGQTSGMTDGEREWWTMLLTTNEYTEPADKYVIEIRCNGLTDAGAKYGTPRHPQYVRIRTDKYATECMMDQFLQ